MDAEKMKAEIVQSAREIIDAYMMWHGLAEDRHAWDMYAASAHHAITTSTYPGGPDGPGAACMAGTEADAMLVERRKRFGGGGK